MHTETFLKVYQIFHLFSYAGKFGGSQEDSDDREDETDLAAFENYTYWTPEPLELEMRAPTPGARPVDIISMLVDIYGSKEMFVNEYR